MKKVNQVATLILSTIALIFSIIAPNTTLAATDPSLSVATSFSIIAQTAITGTASVSGDVALNSTGAGITALTAAMVGGTIYSPDGVAPGLAILNQAVQANLSTANENITSQTLTASIGPVLDGEIRSAGVYDIGAGRLNGGILTLNGPGIYLFRASSDLISVGSIILTNGARACDVYWQVNTLATISDGSFVGTIIAGTGVHFGANVSLNGRALALGGDVTLLDNNISGPTCANPPSPATLNIIKTVINDNGGTAIASDFTINVTGTNVSTSSFPGSATGISVTLTAGSYDITEINTLSYLQSSSTNCSGTINAGETKTCTITNNDINSQNVDTAPRLIVNKVVINDDGGSKVISDFQLFIGTSTVLSGVLSTTTVGLHTISETTDPGYTATISGDCAVDGTITLALGETKTCTITNNDINSQNVPTLPHLIINKIVINDDGGTKVISDFQLFIGTSTVLSGAVSTTTVGLHTISETTDPNYIATIGGDCALNGTVTLALGETKTCTITNNDVFRQSGNSSSHHSSSGGSRRVVSSNILETINTPSPLLLASPRLPNTGLPPTETNIPWNIIIPISLLSFLTLVYFTQRRRTI